MASAMEPEEKNFLIAVTLWGGAFVTVFGCGLYAFIESSPGFGIIYAVIGLGGLLYMTLHLKGKRLGTTHIIAALLVLTWIFFGYTIWATYSSAPQIPSDIVLKPGVARCAESLTIHYDKATHSFVFQCVKIPN